MNNPFHYIPDRECEAAFRQLVCSLQRLKNSRRPEDVRFIEEVESGKMLGVLIAADSNGAHRQLYAFSGQLGECGFYRTGFVGPVFDYLAPDGYFKSHERRISAINQTIRELETDEFDRINREYERKKALTDTELAEFKEQCRKSKTERDRLRGERSLSPEEEERLKAQSQFEKAELQRLKKRLSAELEPWLASLTDIRLRIQELCEKRRQESESLQKWLFVNFRILNALGESRSLADIFAETPLRVPPSGAGECCAPKLLHAAYQQGLKPLAIAEYWYGRPKEGEVRIAGHHYPACRGKCLPILNWMLRGLEVTPPLGAECYAVHSYEPEIIFENEWFCVVNKPEGMLSVPGRGHAQSVEAWLNEHYGPGRNVKMAHRLDQDTSGLMVAAFGPESLKTLQSRFARREVVKTYVADLLGDFRAAGVEQCGRIELPLAPDWLDRPRQKVDTESGKPAVTDYEFIETTDGRSRVLFRPHTGRTHQLRMHAASHLGLGMPIVGDRLYGHNMAGGAERLHLHAWKLEFDFPLDGRHYHFQAPVPF